MRFLKRLFGSKANPSGPASNAQPDDIGMKLRLKMLGITAADAGITPTVDFPHVFAVIMDWHIPGVIATVFATSTGAASLYTTSTFGIIGGEAHEWVRLAAIRFTQLSNKHFHQAKPVSEFPYPVTDRLFFYLLTFEGVRRLDWKLDEIHDPTTDCHRLFGLGQQVLSELRRITESKAPKTVV